MKNSVGAICFLAGLVCCLFLCGDKGSSSDGKDTGVALELIGFWEQVSPDSSANYFIAKSDSIIINKSLVLSPVSAKNGQIWSEALGKYFYDYTRVIDTLYLVAETTTVATAPTSTTVGVIKLLLSHLTVIGNWQEYIPSSTFIPEALTIGIDVEKSDSSFLISVIEEPAKQMFNHEGFWSITGDSIYLAGTFCEMLDTSANPDTLVALPDSVCQQIIVLDTARTADDIWKITMGDLGPIIESFPLDPMFVDIIKSIKLEMERQ